MIRPFHPDDTEALIDIWYAASQVAHSFLSPEFLALEKERIREIYLPKTRTWVHLGPHGINGFVSMLGSEVAALFVRPEHHRQGIGRVLMDHVRGMHDTLTLEVFRDNPLGRSFYRGYGFEEIGERLHVETGQVVVQMRLARDSFNSPPVPLSSAV
ncbi:MAG: GNAT family N-acetyltransferase [Saprospiraceae bacterium]|nr:GNAT family N-acetyltransferase [Saprospiraceae bacterium]